MIGGICTKWPTFGLTPKMPWRGEWPPESPNLARHQEPKSIIFDGFNYLRGLNRRRVLHFAHSSNYLDSLKRLSFVYRADGVVSAAFSTFAAKHHHGI